MFVLYLRRVVVVPIELFLTFIAASVLLIIIPGPNVALIVADGIAHGGRAALTTVAGTSTGIALQLAITCAGMLPLIWLLAEWFECLRWLGVAYMVFLAFQAFRSPAVNLSTAPAASSNKRLYWRGLLVSLTNPKTMLFYAAFFPQFIDATGDRTIQLILLSSIFLVLAVLLDASYAILAGKTQKLFENPLFSKWRNRMSGTFLLGAAFGLGLARRS